MYIYVVHLIGTSYIRIGVMQTKQYENYFHSRYYKIVDLGVRKTLMKKNISKERYYCTMSGD